MAPRDIANQVTAEVLMHMQLDPQQDFETASLVQGMVENLIIPRPAAKPAGSKAPPPQALPRFKQ
jgi:hypothetical protein